MLSRLAEPDASTTRLAPPITARACKHPTAGVMLLSCALLWCDAVIMC